MNAIAFNVLLCLFPLLLVLVAAAQRLSPGSGTAQVLRLLLAELIPFGGETIAASLRQMTRLARGFEVLSLALVVWGSSGVFMPVEMALDRVWGGEGPRSFWKSRLLAFALTVAGGALALLSVALTLLVRGFGRDCLLRPAGLRRVSRALSLRLERRAGLRGRHGARRSETFLKHGGGCVAPPVDPPLATRE